MGGGNPPNSAKEKFCQVTGIFRPKNANFSPFLDHFKAKYFGDFPLRGYPLSGKKSAK